MVEETDEGYVCEGCERFFTSKSVAEKHEFDCPELATIFRRFGNWLSARFIKKYGFDRRKSSTKMLEFLYFRYLADWGAAIVFTLFIIVRFLLMFEIDAIPYSGTIDYSDKDIFMLGISGYILVGSLRNIKEYRLKVIDEIPKLQRELGTTKTFQRK